LCQALVAQLDQGFFRPLCPAGGPFKERCTMNPIPSPLQLIELSIRTSIMLTEAQMIIGMRMMGMMGLWRVLPSENARMSSEKVAVMGQVALASSQALMSGKPPTLVAAAALKPIRRKTASNVKRLARRGPGKP
jgi:hypothetical protein